MSINGLCHVRKVLTFEGENVEEDGFPEFVKIKTFHKVEQGSIKYKMKCGK